MEKKEFDGFMEELRGSELTVVRRKEILDIIHKRVNEVLENITRRRKVDLHWYSFSTDRAYVLVRGEMNFTTWRDLTVIQARMEKF